MYYVVTYLEKVCTLTSCIFSMMSACGSTRLSRTDKCSTILSSLPGQHLANSEKGSEYSLDMCLRCCSISVDLTRRNLSQLRGDLLDLRFEGFHGTFDGFNSRVLLKETPNSIPLSLDIGLPLLDFLIQRLEFVVDWWLSAHEKVVCQTRTYILFP